MTTTPTTTTAALPANLFRGRDGRIAEHRYTCCGERLPDTVRHITEDAPMVERRPA